LAIVVLGVIIATQANNWNEARIEREQGRSYRERLIADLRSNEADMQQRRVYYLDVRRRAMAALDVIERPSAPAGERFLVDAYQATQILPRTVRRFTYDEMIAVGGIDRLGDATLRERITNYYASLQTTEKTISAIPPYREHLRQVMPYAAQQRVRSHCREVMGVDAAGAAVGSLPISCSLDLDSTIAARAAAQVRGAPGITGDLTRYLVDLDLKLDLFTVLGRRARDLRQRLEAQPA
ncbi:MAG: hypothetical protein ABIP07_02235, partial [Sphingomicrobium sp.]